MLMLGLLLAACGPAQPARDETALAAQAQEIAQTYLADGDLAKARTAIEGVAVANPRQWLVLVTEQAIAEAGEPSSVAALVKLTEALNLQSGAIQAYAQQHGLAAPTPDIPAVALPTLPVVAAAGAAPAASTPETAAAPSATLPPAETGSTAVPATDPMTTSVPAPTSGVLALAIATPTLAVPSLATPTPTASQPVAVASDLINVRGGPGTIYAVVDALAVGEQVNITGKNDDGDWYEVQLASGQRGWVLGQLVSTQGDTASVALATNIPAPPPTAVPAAAAPAEPVATAAPAPTEVPPAQTGPDFRLVEKRLWDVYENGGTKNGPTVTCGEKRELRVVVLDANGSRLNGVAIQALLGAREVLVTGAQGKGDGQAEFVLGGGQDITIIRDADGREVTADVVYGLTTDPRGIPFEALIAGQFCDNADACNAWVNDPHQPPPCLGHYSWTVTFQRRY